MIVRRRFVVTGLVFAFIAGMSSSAVGQELPKLKEKKTYKVGFSQTESNNPWRLAETESVKSEAAKRGFQLVYTDAAGSAAKQVADVNSMIAQGVDVILLAPREEKIPEWIKSDDALFDEKNAKENLATAY
jgi:galactofuranose transport system substrate-binding protein